MSTTAFFLKSQTVIRAFVLTGLISGVAHANSLFEFENDVGLEKCLTATDVATVSGEKREKVLRGLDPGEIQFRCLERVQGLIDSGSLSVDMLNKFIVAIKQNSAPVNALDVIRSLAKKKIEICNRTDIYEILVSGLGYPQEEGAYYKKTTEVLDVCVKNAEFLTDLKDELSSAKGIVGKNLKSYFNKTNKK